MNKKTVKIKKKVKIAIYSFILLFILSIYTIFSSTVFDLKKIELRGNTNITIEDVMKITNIELEKNLFQYKLNKIENRIMLNPYAKEIKVKRKLPNTIVIDIEEYKEDAIIHYNNKYIIINKNGKILSEKDKVTNNDIPIISKVEVKKKDIGSNIELKDEFKQKGLLYLLECIDKNNLKRDIKSIELNEDNFEMINDNGIKILIKIDEDIEYNINRLSQIILDLKTKSKKNGRLDLRNKDQAVYSPL